MIGAVLAGGYGRRLKPITNDIPKSLISIRENFTILDRQISDFLVMGIDEIYILSGHLGGKIQEYLDLRYPDVRIEYFREEKPLGTLYSMRNLIENRKDSDIFLRNGDTVTDLSFKSMLKFSNDSDYGMVLYAAKMRSPYGVLETFGDTVTRFREKPFINAYINAGLYIFKKKIFNYFFDDYPEKELETTVFPRLASKKLIGAYFEDAFWMGIDSEKDLEAVREEYANRKDEPWGYVKTINSGKAMIRDYFVKADEKVNIKVESPSIVRFHGGSGLMTKPRMKFREGTVCETKNEIELHTSEATRFEVFTP